MDFEKDLTENTQGETAEEDITDAAEKLAKNASDSWDYSRKYFTMPKGAVENDEIVDGDFWKGITLPDVDEKPRGKNVARRIILNTLFAVVFLGTGFLIACVSARGKGVVSNLVTGGKHMTFNMKLADRPEAADELKDESGKYTAQGIAEVCGPSVVSLDIFTEQSTIMPSGKGSGIIISTDGYIVSNAHVIDKAKNGIKAVLSDGREYAAEVIGSDPRTDIAVIKIPATDLQPAEFGNSDQVKLGEDVVCIGTPAGYRHSITKGVVSGTDRRVIPENSTLGVSCLQVDAAINPGNSGGAMFNMWGQVIGITSSKLASIDYEGIGFAITTNEAKSVIEDLMETGTVKGKARMGIVFVQITEATAELTNSTPGLCVQSIAPECDVANTDLQLGDLITHINGTSVNDIEDVPAYVRKMEPGDEVTCHVIRKTDDNEKEFDITFKLMDDRNTLVEDTEE
ncbi:S1C family serine protease [Ruminococcus albus]|uniref:Probable periplasmic serine endoprotease DegP-like n=1 Tax=Ruminococcus albus TaxID=1264 RepID=A0A1I1HRF9_RUMAL|nr:trypsin-like peptidase domain-containing protein [Ruminococcus albus]SFC23590.1 serine protease Do [Ruminococcus albus]